ncbi:hypothetical protein [Eudoraea adriatica]|uniref:hypothetical protein n=1 Tax=Eudoraea adriatica TaxID=446681 RepID=UPI0003726E02|nr:hypothetical protein [Eudoraea adriatica]
MKKLITILVLAFFTTIAFGQDEKPLFLIFEFMHVDEGQWANYEDTEEFWEKVHVQRVKNGDCIGWDLWRLEPSGQEQGSQFMTVSLYNDPVKMMEGGDFNKAWTGAYPNLTEAESNEKMAMTAKSRDLTHRVFLRQIDITKDDFDMPIGTLAVINFMKAKPGQSAAYEKMESEVFKPMHQKDVESGGRASWGMLRNMLGYATDAYATHIVFDMYTGYDQFFNGGNNTPLTAAQQKAMQDIANIRDLKSLTHATLIRKVR